MSQVPAKIINFSKSQSVIFGQKLGLVSDGMVLHGLLKSNKHRKHRIPTTYTILVNFCYFCWFNTFAECFCRAWGSMKYRAKLKFLN